MAKIELIRGPSNCLTADLDLYYFEHMSSKYERIREKTKFIKYLGIVNDVKSTVITVFWTLIKCALFEFIFDLRAHFDF